MRKATILYDRSGRSTGQAEIEFTRASDAERAKEQYNGVPLDGRPMRIEIPGVEAEMVPLRRPMGGGMKKSPGPRKSLSIGSVEGRMEDRAKY